jgi:hypothetical protein
LWCSRWLPVYRFIGDTLPDKGVRFLMKKRVKAYFSPWLFTKPTTGFVVNTSPAIIKKKWLGYKWYISRTKQSWTQTDQDAGTALTEGITYPGETGWYWNEILQIQVHLRSCYRTMGEAIALDAESGRFIRNAGTGRTYRFSSRHKNAETPGRACFFWLSWFCLTSQKKRGLGQSTILSNRNNWVDDSYFLVWSEW